MSFSPCTENFYISILSYPTSSILHAASYKCTSSIPHYKSIRSNHMLSYPTKILKIISVGTKIRWSQTIVLYKCKRPWSFMQQRESLHLFTFLFLWNSSSFLKRKRRRAPLRDHFVRRVFVCPSVTRLVCLYFFLSSDKGLSYLTCVFLMTRYF